MDSMRGRGVNKSGKSDAKDDGKLVPEGTQMQVMRSIYGTTIDNEGQEEGNVRILKNAFRTIVCVV